MSLGQLELRSNPFQIQIHFHLSEDSSFDAFVQAAQSLVEKLIPESFWLEMKNAQDPDSIQSCFFRLSKQIPIIRYRSLSGDVPGLSVKMLGLAEFADGSSRYISETCSNWLVPGKISPSMGGMSIRFHFALYPEKHFFLFRQFFSFDHRSDLTAALNALPQLSEEMRITILAVQQARYIASVRSLSIDQKSLIIQQSLSSLLNLFNAESNRNAFDQMHHFLMKLSGEEKLGQVKRNIAHLMQSRPKNFDRDMFHEITAIKDLLPENFTSMRDSKHISRVLALHYLFRKMLRSQLQKAPQERHLSLKIWKTQLAQSYSTPRSDRNLDLERAKAPGFDDRNSPHISNMGRVTIVESRELSRSSKLQVSGRSGCVIGIIVGINLLRESERFDKRHLLEAIHSCLPSLAAIPDSFLLDRRDDKLRLLYLEMQKPQNAPFTSDEIKLLRAELPLALKRRVESAVPPIFMPRNEEEVLRNIVVLSKQIRFLRDLPHLMISYEKQTDNEVCFLIIMVRLLKERDLAFKDLLKGFDTALRLTIDETRSAGALKRKYPKEAVIFRAQFEKAPFFRKDDSLDLKRARQKVVAELKRLLGDFRDFNGGMIHKQDEALEQLRKTLGPTAQHHEVLLENFFYSLRPGIMQTVHSSQTLRTLFGLLLQVLDEDLEQKSFGLKIEAEGKYLYAMIGAVAPTFKEEIITAISRLKIPSYDLTMTFLHVQELATLGYILRADDPEKRALFQQTLLDAMLKWKINFSCTVK